MLETPLAAITAVGQFGFVFKSFAHLDCIIFTHYSFLNFSSSVKLVVDHW
jgi:hypothetical protein